MDKEKILEMSRQENKGKNDEREASVYAAASRVGMAVGALVCIMLVIISEFVIDVPEVGMVGWLVYFAMLGASSIVVYRQLKKRINLVTAILELLCAVMYTISLIVKNVG